MDTAAPTLTFGPLTAEAVGILLKEAVRRAIQAIRSELFVFEATLKTGGAKLGPDYVTTADIRAQAIFAKLFSECFPGWGVVGEESLFVDCTLPGVTWFLTVDPLDGTNAMVRRQSHGIGVMVSMVMDGRIVSAWVGDVMTEEIYGYRAGSEKVHRISGFNHAERLVIDESRPLETQNVVLTDKPSRYGPLTRLLTGIDGAVSPFKGVEVSGGSIGVLVARLWKSEVGAVVMTPHEQPPWDFTPVLGISRHLGFVFLAADPATGRFTLADPQPSMRAQPMSELLIIHGSRAADFLRWQDGLAGR